MSKEKENLIKEIENILSEWDNEDETLDQLQKAMEFFCGNWDIAEGYKYAIQETLQDQNNNHGEDLTVEDLITLKVLLLK